MCTIAVGREALHLVSQQGSGAVPSGVSVGEQRAERATLDGLAEAVLELARGSAGACPRQGCWQWGKAVRLRSPADTQA